MTRDLLSENPDAKLDYVTTGIVFKCDSTLGLCWDMKDRVDARNGNLVRPLKSVGQRKKFHLIYKGYNYRVSMMGSFTRTEYYLPNGELIYTNDCEQGHGACHRIEMNTVLDLFNEYASQAYRRRTKSSKPKRKIVKKKTKVCRCK